MKYCFDQVPDRKGTLSYKWDFNNHEFPQRPDAIPMWVADTDFPCPQAIVDAIQMRAAHPIYAYSMIGDNFSDLVASWQKRHNGWEIKPEWIAYCNGIVPALNVVIQSFTQVGEGIIIQPPVYYPFKNSVVNNHRKLLENNLIFIGDRWVINYEELEQLAAKPETRLLLLCSPHNPVSRVFTKEELLQVGEICLNHNVLIMSDEIHSDLIYPGGRHLPIASLSEEIGNITITAMSPSKAFNIAGLQISMIIAQNDELRQRFDTTLGQHAYIPNLFGSVALEAAYSNPCCEEYVDQLMGYLWGNYQLLNEQLRAYTPKISCQKPEATYLMWLDCHQLELSDVDLKAFFVEEAGLGIELGSMFGASGAGFVRMNIGCTRATIVQAAKQLREAYEKRKF